MPEETKRIRAQIISGTTDKVRDIVNLIDQETEQLTADELSTLSIIICLNGQIRREAEEQKPRLRIL